MQTTDSGPLLLVDAASLYFRAFYGVPQSVTTPDGRPINAVRGFLDMLSTVIAQRRPDAVVACLDEDWRPQFRVAALPSYKAHRVAPEGGEEVPDELGPQVPVLLEVLDALGVTTCGVPGYEADDVIGTLTERADTAVEVLTGDRDLFQLVRDPAAGRPGVRVLYTAKGIRAMEAVDEAWVAAKYGIPGDAYADFAVLRGDPSDGLPGVPGVGDKSASALISRFGSVAAIRQAIAEDVHDGFPAGARRKIAAAADYLDVAPSVVLVAREIEHPAIETALPGTLPAGPADPERVHALAHDYGIATSLARFVSVMNRAS